MLRCRLLLPALVCLLFAAHGHAQLPKAKLTGIKPVGAKQGAEVSVKISGGDLDDASKLLFSHDGITAVQKTIGPDELHKAATPIENEFTVKVAGNVPPGLYEVRAVGRYGITNPRTFQVGNFDDIAEAGDNSTREKAMPLTPPVIVNGEAGKDTVDYYKIAAKPGQRILVDCWAQRIDSRMDATLKLFDPTGREVQLVRDTDRLDPVMEINPDAEGEYTLAVYDFTYEGSGSHFYRLAVHQGPYIDFIYPPVGQAGQAGKFTIYGRNLPGGKPVDGMDVAGSSLQQQEVSITLPGDPMSKQRLSVASLVEPHAGVVDTHAWQLTSPQGASNSVSIAYAQAPIVLEAEPNNDAEKPQAITPPCEYVGQFYPRGDRDWVQFDAKQGDVYWIDLISHRMGVDTDPSLLIEQVQMSEQGEMKVSQVANMDDATPAPNNNNQAEMFKMRHRDPRIKFEAKADATYRVQISDLYADSRNDPRMAYRLVIRKAQPDFTLVAYAPPSNNKNQFDVSGFSLRRGEAAAVKVVLRRRDGFDGDVQITAEGLPAGVTCNGATLSGGSGSADLVFLASADAAAAASSIRIVGKAKINDADVTREARTGAVIWGTKNIQQELPFARMTRNLGLAVIDSESMPATVTAGDGKVIETCKGAKISVPIKVARAGDFKGAVKLKIQGVPKELTAGEANVTAAEGKSELNLTNGNLKPGTYTATFGGPVKFKYSRNPAALKKAQDRQKELEGIVKELGDKAKQAADAAKAARDAANKNKEDKALADKATQAEEASKAAAELKKKADDLKKKADDAVKNITNAAKPKDVTINVVSTPITINVDSDPIVVTAASPGAKKQGDKFEIAVTIERKYGFEDQVEVSFEAPNGVGGVSAQKVTIPKGQTQGKIEVTLNANAKPGEHQFTLRGRSRFNNVQLDDTQQLALKIEAVEQPK